MINLQLFHFRILFLYFCSSDQSFKFKTFKSSLFTFYITLGTIMLDYNIVEP